MSPEFLITTLIVCITPGTGVIYTLAAGISRGARASILAAFACTLGTVPAAVAAVTGTAALLHTSATAFQVLKYLGVAYLLWLAWSTWRDESALVVEEGSTPPSVRRVLARGILLNVLNPKLTIFFFAFLPQFVPAGEPGAFGRMVALSGVFMLATFLVFAVYGVLAAAVRNRIISRPRVMTWLRRAFAGSFVALGARLAVTSR